MEHKGTVRLESDRLILRRFEQSDAVAMFENWATDPLTTKYLTWEPHQSVMTTAEFISGIITLYDNPMNYNWVIELKSEKTVIGNINFHSISNRNERVELGFCMGSRWWNKGLMTEAVGTAIRFAFEQLGAYKVCAEYQEENVASGKVMMKNKMIFEGRLRSHLKNKKGTFSDVLYYGILRDEWLELNKNG
ncbi:MAG: GNAT family N-acetyltransferase [Clostridia bacterium]|nr:GNAT family N-acetyltransferase [Clostridia bacterium]